MIYSGIGNWCGIGNWSENNLGNIILTGNSNFIGRGYLSTIVFRTKLQITRKNVSIIPVANSEIKTNIWEGNLSLVSGNVQGILSRQIGNDYPKIYNIIGKYSQKLDKSSKTLIIKVLNLKITK